MLGWGYYNKCFDEYVLLIIHFKYRVKNQYLSIIYVIYLFYAKAKRGKIYCNYVYFDGMPLL